MNYEYKYRKYKTKYLNLTGGSIKDNIESSDNTNLSIDYEHKYHKYKTKYLKLKGGLKGGLKGRSKKTIYTIGHSTRTLTEFIKILTDNDIKCLVDVRSYPGSAHEPQFNLVHLEKILPKHGISYTHVIELGGRRHDKPDLNTALRSKSFSSYASYMRTDSFAQGIKELKRIARKCRTVIMCSEAVWWRCHRRMISDLMTFKGWKVYHLGLGKNPEEHIVWDVAHLDKNGQISYDIKRTSRKIKKN